MELAIAAASGSLVVTGLRCRTTGSAAAADVAWRVTSTARLCRRAMASGRAARLMVSQVSAAGCKTCKGKGAVECPGCKVHTPTIMGMLPLIFLSTSLTLHKTELADVMQGTGKNKKNGNIFERWKCFDCQGFGLKSCPSCGKGGLTPEQRGER